MIELTTIDSMPLRLPDMAGGNLQIQAGVLDANLSHHDAI